MEQQASDKSAMTKMQHQYWVTKQAVFRKLGKKDDECIEASDAELDAKLELFRSIQDSCVNLQRIVDKYQERICRLAQEENSMGRFLKEAGKNDKTQAGKAMIAVGKSLSYSGQQRLSLRSPLLRLYQEVETFRHRAIGDTLQNVTSMEKSRTEYRASLSWMKNVSQELDPDTYKQLEKFRKVQGQVRNSKARFDKGKLVCLQKVDLLAAARCNMFSHALILYHNCMLQFAEKVCKAFGDIMDGFEGYRHYEFSVVKELADLPQNTEKLVTETCDEEEEDKDKFSFFEAEFHDEASPTKNNEHGEIQSASLENLLPLSETAQDILIDLVLDDNQSSKEDNAASDANMDLLTGELSSTVTLEEIFRTKEWSSSSGEASKDAFLPSQLLARFGSLDASAAQGGAGDSGKDQLLQKTTPSKGKALPSKATDKKSTWFDLFADLDPLSDPDAVGRTSGHIDRNC